MAQKGQERTAAATARTLRGSGVATVDGGGRLKLPADFRRALQAASAGRLYVTSLDGEAMWIVPLAAWRARERRILALTRRHPVVERYILRTAYWGQQARLDAQGRVPIPPLLRAPAGLEGEVVVLGALDRLEVWNHARLRTRFAAEPLEPADRLALAELGL